MLHVGFVDVLIPVLVAAILVFILSAVCWTALPHHKADCNKLPDEEKMLETLRSVPGGRYAFPHMDCMKTEEGKALMERGPWGYMRVWPVYPKMGSSLGLTFAVFLVASALLGYLGAATLEAGAGFWRVVQVIGTASLLTYTLAMMPHNIWWERSLRTFLADVFDGVLYALGTTLVFALLWPGVDVPQLPGVG